MLPSFLFTLPVVPHESRWPAFDTAAIAFMSNPLGPPRHSTYSLEIVALIVFPDRLIRVFQIILRVFFGLNRQRLDRHCLVKRQAASGAAWAPAGLTQQPSNSLC